MLFCIFAAMILQKKYTPHQAWPKIKHYCAYQERCHSEVKNKLYGFGLNKKEVEEAISKLIEELYLNEERFAIHFAGGKFRMKQWGKVKIRYELKQKQVSEYSIKKALAAIDKTTYQKTFYKLFEDKLSALKSEKNTFTRKRKIQDYLLNKGYEIELIREVINDL